MSNTEPIYVLSLVTQLQIWSPLACNQHCITLSCRVGTVICREYLMQPNKSAVQVFTKTQLDLYFSFHSTVENHNSEKKNQGIVYKYFSALIDLKYRSKYLAKKSVFLTPFLCMNSHFSQFCPFCSRLCSSEWFFPGAHRHTEKQHHPPL